MGNDGSSVQEFIGGFGVRASGMLIAHPNEERPSVHDLGVGHRLGRVRRGAQLRGLGDGELSFR